MICSILLKNDKFYTRTLQILFFSEIKGSFNKIFTKASFNISINNLMFIIYTNLCSTFWLYIVYIYIYIYIYIY